MTNLKPCPFCGSLKIDVRNGCCLCESCGASGPCGTFSDARKIEWWNTRATDPAVKRLVAAADEIVANSPSLCDGSVGMEVEQLRALEKALAEVKK